MSFELDIIADTVYFTDPKLVNYGLEFIEEHSYLIDEYGEDGLEIILDEYWSGS